LRPASTARCAGSAAYTSLGQESLVTQYDNATVGSGSVVNETKTTYDDWGNVEKYEEDRDSAVGAGTPNDYEVSYTYAKANTGRNTVRRRPRPCLAET
jgi:hypothetical protein